MKERIKIHLFNKTVKEIDRSDFTYITEDIFANRGDIVKVELPEGVEEICDYAFEHCENLEEVICPKSLKRIGREAFVDCAKLSRIQYEAEVEVDAAAFKGCRSLA